MRSILSTLEAVGSGVISVPETLFDGLLRTGEGLKLCPI